MSSSLAVLKNSTIHICIGQGKFFEACLPAHLGEKVYPENDGDNRKHDESCHAFTLVDLCYTGLSFVLTRAPLAAFLLGIAPGALPGALFMPRR